MTVPDYVCDGDGIEEVRLPSLDESHCRSAIERASDLLVAGRAAENYDCYTQDAMWIRVVLPERVLYENAFYDHVRLHCPGVVPELRKLIEKSTDCLNGNIRTGRLFAAFALAWLDEASLPLVARCLRITDAEHNADFTEEEVLKLVARHGWSLPMIDFAVAWLELADARDGGERPVDQSLRAGAKALMSGEKFARRYHDVLTLHGIAAYAEPNHDEEDGWQWGRYFGTHAVDRMWFNYYASFADYIGYYGPEQLNRTDASFQKIVDDASWRMLLRQHRLSDWDRIFFITFWQIAKAKSILPKVAPSC